MPVAVGEDELADLLRGDEDVPPAVAGRGQGEPGDFGELLQLGLGVERRADVRPAAGRPRARSR